MAYPITQEVLDLFTTQHRQIVDITFNGVAETKTLTEKDVIQGGLSIDRYCVSGSRIEIGSAVAAELSLTLDNTDGKFNDTTFEGAELFINVGTKKWEARKWENAVEHFIPMGYFTVDNSPRKLSHITLSALDRMVHFDKDVEPERLSFPMTVGNLLEQICNICNVELATDILTLINQDYVINEYPQGDDLIYRQLLMWIAEITGTCAYIDWEGKLRLEWYKTESSARIDATMRFSSDLLENALTISGVRIKVSDEENVLYGDESYALLIEGNNLIQHDSEALAQSIYNKVGGFTYTPYECVAKPFVNLYPLDSIVFVDKDGVEVPTVVTNTTFLINGNIGISAKGETATNDGYASANPLTKQEAIIIEKAKKEANKNLSESVQSILSFNELISNALGIYATVVTDKSGGKQYYMHDSPNLEDSNTIYTLNAGGYAYTNSGWNNGNPVWQYGFDKNGNAIYKKVCAYGMEVSNPNGSYSATISPQAFEIWQNAVLLLSASQNGLKVYDGGITVYKGTGSNAEEMLYFDNSGNIAMNGYITQDGSNLRLLVGSGYEIPEGSTVGRWYSGILLYDRIARYLRSDGTYKPFIEFWAASSPECSVMEAMDKLRICITGLEEETNYTRAEFTSTGGTLYGDWQFSQDQKLNKGLYAYNLGIYRNSTITGQLYRSDANNTCLADMQGQNVCLVIKSGDSWKTKLLAGIDSSTLYGDWQFSQNQKFNVDIATTAAFQLYNGNTLVGNIYEADNNLVITNAAGDVQLGVSGYNFIRGHREHGYSKAIIYNYDLRAGSNIIVDATKVGSTNWDSSGYYYIKMESGYGWGIVVGTSYRISANGSGGHLYGTWYANSCLGTTSDEDKKNSIEELPEKYSALFDNLRPVRYKYNDGTSDRFHTGFIAQEVEQALTDSEIDSQEFAGFVKNEDGECFLRYEEFIALAVNEVQTLKKKNSDLEQRVADLESKLENILSKLGGETNGGDN